MKLCVVGAGSAGICAAKNAIEFGCDVTVFEQTSEVGGTWVYTNEVGKDKNGMNVHSSMYQNLVTNFPKEVMAFSDFPFPEQGKSYLPSDDIRKYYKSYADHFKVTPLIRFNCQVFRILPLPDEKWEVTVQQVETKKFETSIFDAVLVCVGRNFSPNESFFEGQENFLGMQMHSHDYRSPEKFENSKVLIVGGGASAFELVHKLSAVAERVIWSHHLDERPEIDFTDKITEKPDVTKFTENGVKFVDGSYQEISAVIFCTGYKFSFPFLSIDCGLKCTKNYLRPLFKHCINISHPTMGFIGLVYNVCPPVFDMQIKFCLTFMTERRKLPSKQEMIDDFKCDRQERKDRGVYGKGHIKGFEHAEIYYNALVEASGIEPMRPIMLKICNQAAKNYESDTFHFRSKIFKIIDEENFICFDEKDL